MKKTVLLAGCVLAVSLMFSFGCEKMQNNGETTTPTNLAQPVKEGTTPENPIPGAMTPGTVGVIEAGPAKFNVEIVESDAGREQGLKNRESLPEGQGMWFIFPVSENYSFWMKDTVIALDWIFVDGENPQSLKVVAILADNKPNDDKPKSPEVKFKYALEVNAGLAAKLGIKVGDPVKLSIGPR